MLRSVDQKTYIKCNRTHSTIFLPHFRFLSLFPQACTLGRLEDVRSLLEKRADPNKEAFGELPHVSTTWNLAGIAQTHNICIHLHRPLKALVLTLTLQRTSLLRNAMHLAPTPSPPPSSSSPEPDVKTIRAAVSAATAATAPGRGGGSGDIGEGKGAAGRDRDLDEMSVGGNENEPGNGDDEQSENQFASSKSRKTLPTESARGH